MTNIRRTYIDNAEGQLHVWSWMRSQSNQPPLICLPPVPFGGRFFASFATAYGGPVWSADLPGYGGSDPLGDAPTVGGVHACDVSVVSGFINAGMAHRLSLRRFSRHRYGAIVS